MRVLLIGSDYEENLGLAMLAASLMRARHRVKVTPYNEIRELDEVVEQVLATRPRLVGLAIQFQHRSHDFLLLARRLRAAGYRGHITCGGQYPTLAFAEVLRHEPAVDSVVLHEGERSLVELADALSRDGSLEQIPGLALRDEQGRPYRTSPRRLCNSLDELPFAFRYRPHTRQLGIPFIPVSGSRGCWGSCAFCSITTYYRDAQAYGGARKLRLRSPENVAAEMAALWHAAQGPCIFCFHDDTFLLPRPADSLERVRAIRRTLDEFGVGKAGLIGKTRPDCVTPELARELRRLGVIRMFLGVENASQPGQDHLGRRTRTEDIERAVAALEGARIFICYNLLMFEPDATLDDIRDNVAFMRAHAHIPVNFCRAEPYHGTPLYQRIQQYGELAGSFLGWDYRIRDDRTELLFRICATAFRERNFDPRGVANRYMGLGYTAQILRTFHDCSSRRGQRLLQRARELIEQVTTDTAELLEEALKLASIADLSDHDRIERETALLGLRVAAHDRVWHPQLDGLTADIEAYVAEQPETRHFAGVPKRLREVLQGLAVAGCVAVTAQGCGGETEDDRGGTVVDAGVGGSGGYPPDSSDWLPPPTGGWHGDGGGPTVGGSGGNGATGGWTGDGGTSGTGGLWDPAPPPFGGTGGYGATGGWTGDGGAPSVGGSGGIGATGGWVGDGGTGGFAGEAGAPGGAGQGGASGGSGEGAVAGASGWGGTGAVVDPPPPPAGFGPVDPPPPDAGMSQSASRGTPTSDRHALVERWQDTGPQRAVRTRDLPLYFPPVVTLAARQQGDAVHVRLCGEAAGMSLRWESAGTIEGEGREVVWRPESDDDQLRVAVRTRGGVAIRTLRACQVCGG